MGNQLQLENNCNLYIKESKYSRTKFFQLLKPYSIYWTRGFIFVFNNNPVNLHWAFISFVRNYDAHQVISIFYMLILNLKKNHLL